MRLKKLVSLLFIAALVIAGCSSGNGKGDSNSDGDVTELTFWTPLSGTDGEFMTDMVKAFNDSQDDVKVEVMNNVWDDYYTKLKTSLVSNAAPDIAIAHYTNLAELVPTGKVQAIDDLASEVGVDWSKYGENQVESVTIDGQMYAVPLDTHAVIMFYNNDLLGEAGLLNADGTLKVEPGAEGFTNLLRSLKEKLPSGTHPLVIGSNNIFTFWIWHALVSQQGGAFMTDGAATVNTPESQTAMELMQTWLEEGLMPADIGDQSYDMFKEGQAAITLTGVWATGNFESNDALNFTATKFPQLYDQQAAWGNSHNLIIPVQDNEEKQKAAVKFADWLTDHGVMWAKAGHVPAKTTVVESDDFQSMEYRPDYADVMNDVKYVPASDQATAIQDAILESLVEINYGQVTVEQGLEGAQKKVEELLNK